MTIKNIHNKATWNYDTNYCKSSFFILVKICNCHYCTIHLYSGKLERFDENSITLLLRYIDYYYWNNMTTKSTITVEYIYIYHYQHILLLNGNHQYSPYHSCSIYRTSILNRKQIIIRSYYVLVVSENWNIRKWIKVVLVNDDIKSEILRIYPDLCNIIAHFY